MKESTSPRIHASYASAEPTESIGRSASGNTTNALPPEEELSADLSIIVETATQRSAAYRLLSRLYRTEVDDSLLDELKNMRFPAETGNAKANEGYRAIASYLSGADAHTLTELAADYVRAFIGHGIDAYSAAYPYESVYTSPKRLMMQEARDEVLAIYQAEGLGKLPAWREAEDHLATELEFMAILGDRMADAARTGDETTVERLLVTQKTFLFDHLLNWVPLMTVDVRRFVKHDFYRGLAYLTDGFLQTEEQLFDEVFEEEA